METTLITQTFQLTKGKCFSSDELEDYGAKPTGLQCFSYYPYVLYQKDQKRIILKPLPHNLFKVIRSYNFIPAQ